jgi:hypothetical protein
MAGMGIPPVTPANRVVLSLIVGLAAMSMTITSNLYYYTDIALLQQQVIGGDGFVEYSCAWTAALFQPWLYLVAWADMIPFWSLNWGGYVIVGFVSGIILAGISGWLVWRWPVLSWLFVVVFTIIATGSVRYTVRNFAKLEEVRSRPPKEWP